MTLPEKKALYRRISLQQPEMAAVIDACHDCFPGAKVTFVRLGEETWGEPLGQDYPAIPGPLYYKTKALNRTK